MLASFAVTHRLTQSLFTRKVQSQRTLIISQNRSNTTGRMQNNSSQYTRRTPQHHQKPSSAFLPWHCCVVFRAISKAPANEFQTISGIEIYWQNSNEPVCLPARPCSSHCPELSEHMLLSSVSCLTAKGWFNYSNCLMTEERAAGPCMLVCDKRETLLLRGLHYASLTVT